jgi:hypothetical protein
MDTAASIAPAAATLISAGAGVATSLMNKPKVPKLSAPALTKPATAPVQDDAALTDARRKAVEARMRSSGRQSTILTDQTLGG